MEEKAKGVLEYLSNLELSWITKEVILQFSSGDTIYQDYIPEIERLLGKENALNTDSMLSFKDLLDELPKVSTKSTRTERRGRKKAVSETASVAETGTLWNYLIKNKYDISTFVTLLGIIIQAKISSKEQYELGFTPAFQVAAARVYIKLLSVEGSGAFNVFNNFAFRSVLTLLRNLLTCKQQIIDLSAEDKHQQAEEPEEEVDEDEVKEIRVKKEVVDDEEQEDEDDDEEKKKKKRKRKAPAKKSSSGKRRKGNNKEKISIKSNHVLESMLAEAAEEIVSDCEDLAKDLCEFLATYSLPKESELILYIIERMSDLSRESTLLGTENGKKKRKEAEIPYKIHALCFKILDACLSPNQGDQEKNYSYTLQHLLPNLLNTDRFICQHTLEFIRETVDKVKNGPENVLIYAQHVCMSACEKKADIRNSCHSSLSFLYSQMDEEAKERFCQFLGKMTRNRKSAFRIFAVDTAQTILETAFNELGDSDADEPSIRKTVDSLLVLLMSRFSDKIANVRSKAITGLVHLLQIGVKEPAAKKMLSQIFAGEDTSEEEDDEEMKESPQVEEAKEGEEQSTPVKVSKTSKPRKASKLSEYLDMDDSAGEGVQGQIFNRLLDTSPVVRKAALQLVEQLALLKPKMFLVPQSLDIFKKHAVDASISNRKQALTSLGNLLDSYPMHENLLKSMIVVSVILCFDAEATVYEKAIESMENFVFYKISNTRQKNADIELLWKVLDSLTAEHLQRLRKVVGLFNMKKKLKPGIVKAVHKKLNEDSECKSAWVLLDELASFFPKHIDVEFILKSYKARSKSSVSSSEAENADNFFLCLNTLSKVCNALEKEDGLALANEMRDSLLAFSVPLNLIHPYVTTVNKMYIELSPENREDVFAVIIEECCKRLHYFIFNDIANINTDLVAKILFSSGEIAFHYGKKIIPKLVTLVQALIASSLSSVTQEKPATTTETGTAEAPEMVEASQAEQPKEAPKKRFSKVTLTPQIRAHAFVSLGKMCLVDEALAKKSVPFFITEIEKAQDDVVRNNILVTMCDLCVKYTSVVDRYVARIAESMGDKSPLVRRNAVCLLTQILAEDYIKWRPLLLFRFLAVLPDPHPGVSKAAEYALLSILPKKQANLLFNHFIESIFVLNNYTRHPVFNKFIQTPREVALFSFQGEGMNERKRHAVYKFMLMQFSPEQKLKIHGKLHADVLSMFAEGTIPVEGGSVVCDILSILSSKEMRFSKSKTATLGSAEAEPKEEKGEEEEGDSVITNLNGKLLHEIIKKHVQENVVPVIIELKRALEAQKSPVIKTLMDYLALIMVEYKSEINEMLSADRQLKAELEFDLRKKEITKKAKENPSNTSSTPFKSPFRPMNRTPGSAATTRTETSPFAFKTPMSVPRVRKEATSPAETDNVTKRLFNDEDKENETPAAASPPLVVRKKRNRINMKK